MVKTINAPLIASKGFLNNLVTYDTLIFNEPFYAANNCLVPTMKLNASGSISVQLMEMSSKCGIIMLHWFGCIV